tara:strand:- start:36 stop:236 length:201 start_codon:yes stop_codon:yes gene_type:complete
LLVEVEEEIHPQLLHQTEVMVAVELVIVQVLVHQMCFKEQLTQEEAVELFMVVVLVRVQLVLEVQV